jgi:hypothetical protein
MAAMDVTFQRVLAKLSDTRFFVGCLRFETVSGKVVHG